MGAFHAYDIRGVWGVDFDASLAYKVGYFIPSLLGASKVLVGRDCRLSSQQIRDALVRGVCDAGADVDDLGLATTPLVYYGTASLGYKASVQITASHNPAEYNGMKLSRENALPVGLDSGLGQIKEWVESGRSTPVAERRGRVRSLDIRRQYLDFLQGFKQSGTSGLNLSFDLSNGMACLFAHEVFKGENAGFIFDTLDGSFPNHDPNPLLPCNTQALRDFVRGRGSDLGIIYDGDADRVMFVDDRSRFVAPDLVIALMAEYFCGIKGAERPRVLQEIRSSKGVGEALEEYGAELHTWRVGRAYAAPKLREIDGLWGGELAGHYYFKDFFYSDSGLLASIIMVRIVSALKERGVRLSERMDEMSRYRNSGEINFRVEDKKGAMDAVKAYFESSGTPSAVMDFDGWRLEWPQWWFNIRPSNTEPYLRFICEARSEALLQEKIALAQEIIEKRFGGVRV